MIIATTATRAETAGPVICELECKGCGRCIEACRKNLLELSEALNDRGYHYAVYAGHGCVGCGACYYTCPEPGAVALAVPADSRRTKARQRN